MTAIEMPRAARTATALEWGFIVRGLLRNDAERAKRVAEGQEVFVEGNLKIFPPKGTTWTVDGALAGFVGLSPIQELEARVAEDDRADGVARLSATPTEIDQMETRARIRHAGLDRLRAADEEARARAPRVCVRSGAALGEIVRTLFEAGFEEPVAAPIEEPIVGQYDPMASGLQLALLVEEERIANGDSHAG